MKLILHDLKTEEDLAILPAANTDTHLFSAVPRVSPCTSCFGCWLKTPGMCIIKDRAQNFMKQLAIADELHIVSRILYGGLSTDIKAVLDRSLGFILPYFDIKDGMMHHPPRYDNDLRIHYHIYSFDNIPLDSDEIETMHGIAKANAWNFTATCTCSFYEAPADLKEAFK